MKPWFSPAITLILFFLILFVYTKVAGPIPFSINSVTTNKSDSFTVSGEGKVSIKPDMALITVGITANGATVKTAQDQINNVINQVSINIKKLGVEEKDIQTINYNINPDYDYSERIQRIKGYQASTNLQIKVRDIDKVNQVVDTATSNGANQVGGISFDVADKTKAEDEARQKAVEEAKKKASQAAKIAGFSLGKMINYSENFQGEVPRPFLMQAVGKADSASPSTSVETGSTEIKVTVSLSYEIR